MFLLLSSIALVGLATWKRDSRNVDVLIADMQPVARELQKSLDITGALPATLEKLPSETHYLDHTGRFYARRTDRPVLVAYFPARYAYGLYLRADGRAAVILNDGQVRVEWLAEDTFQEQLQLQTEAMHAFEKQLLERPLNLP